MCRDVLIVTILPFRIRELIRSSTRRVWICAQHFHDLISYDPNAITIINEIFDLHIHNPHMNLKALKQVAHSSLADKRRAAIAETIFQYELHSQTNAI